MIKVLKIREVFLRTLLHSARRWAPEGRERLRGAKRARREPVSRPSSIHRLAGADVKLGGTGFGASAGRRGGRRRALGFGVHLSDERLRAGRANPRPHLNSASRDAPYTTVPNHQQSCSQVYGS